MAYNELIKDFSILRQYLADFFIYGFHSRSEFTRNSARSYDDARRRIQSYLGDFVSFRQGSKGKNVFISLDRRSVTHNPLYRAFKTKSFTDKDITLFFLVMDLLQSCTAMTIKEILWQLDEKYLSRCDAAQWYDESTLRKKLKEYEELGIVDVTKQRRELLYSKNCWKGDLSANREAIRFFTEESPLGVVGSYLEDKLGPADEYLVFKNRYIMDAYDTEVLYEALQGIHQHRRIKVFSHSKRSGIDVRDEVIPLRLYVSSQGGRSYLLARQGSIYKSLRIDYIDKIERLDVVEDYDHYQKKFMNMAKYMWGVTCWQHKADDHLVMDIHVGTDEGFIARRLYRERRRGEVSKIDEETYRFEITVFDAYEMVPWIRSFFGRIKHLECSNPAVMKNLAEDLRAMLEDYGEENLSREGRG